MGFFDWLFSDADKRKTAHLPATANSRRVVMRSRERVAQRQFKRYALRVPVCVRADGKEVWGDSTMLGMGGVFINCPLPLDTATDVTLALELERGLGSQPFEVHGAVAYQTGNGMGIRFTGLSQADYRRLRDVMVYSVAALEDGTGDADAGIC
ncbi:MAG: PilZ domain-containing protein [Nitrospirota bacterium]|nr:PilZ domain-containing protein [Nitrospirota bacterium]